jgi:hypothetical protein
MLIFYQMGCKNKFVMALDSLYLSPLYSSFAVLCMNSNPKIGTVENLILCLCKEFKINHDCISDFKDILFNMVSLICI